MQTPQHKKKGWPKEDNGFILPLAQEKKKLKKG